MSKSPKSGIKLLADPLGHSFHTKWGQPVVDDGYTTLQRREEGGKNSLVK